MKTPTTASLPRWRAALHALAVLSMLASALPTRADGTCNIPESSTSDKPFDADQVMASFANSDCTLETLVQETVFYRYYSYPLAPTLNIGRFWTTDLFDLNSEVIVKLALYPFPPNVQFQNFAYYRELVTVAAGTQVYFGTAGPQPAGDLGSCYAGGAMQYFFADDSISNNAAILFSDATSITKDWRYTNEYGVGDPCNVVPLPGTLLFFVLGAPALASLGRRRSGRV